MLNYPKHIIIFKNSPNTWRPTATYGIPHQYRPLIRLSQILSRFSADCGCFFVCPYVVTSPTHFFHEPIDNIIYVNWSYELENIFPQDLNFNITIYNLKIVLCRILAYYYISRYILYINYKFNIASTHVWSFYFDTFKHYK
jgi:hypothetical protein